MVKALVTKVLNKPITYKQAITGKDAAQWLNGMRTEYNSLIENKVWKLVPLPKNRHALKGRWVFKKKRMENEDFLFKARWVVKGYTQREGIDYTKTYASVVNKATTKIILAVAAARGYYIEQMDIVTAFLYGPLEEEVYVEQPTGFSAKGKEDLVCLLNKALYGLKQSPRAWYKIISTTLKD